MSRFFSHLVLLLACAAPAFGQEPLICVRSLHPPSYPAGARGAGIQGEVRLQIRIGGNGEVLAVEAQSGHPILRKAAEENIRGWRFRIHHVSGQGGR
jgi:TonB family C-terminal domain